MLCFLVIDEDLQVVKVPFAIVAPRPLEDLFESWMASLLAHRDFYLEQSEVTQCYVNRWVVTEVSVTRADSSSCDAKLATTE